MQELHEYTVCHIAMQDFEFANSRAIGKVDNIDSIDGMSYNKSFQAM